MEVRQTGTHMPAKFWHDTLRITDVKDRFL